MAPPVPPSAKTSRRAVSWITVVCLFLIIFAALQLVRGSIYPSQFIGRSLSSAFRPNSNRVSVWHSPRGCAGNFTTGVARDSPDHFPYAIVRDAVIDRRPVAKIVLGKRDGLGVVRIVLYVTTHLSARLSREGSVVQIAGHPIEGKVEYVTHVNPFNIPRVPRGYRPGLKTYYGREVSQWQVGLALSPQVRDGGGVVADAAAQDAAIDANITVIRYDEVGMMMPVRMSLRCVMGWGPLRGVEERRATCGNGARDASGAAVFSSGMLFGVKKLQPKYYREVGNFAARALMGPLKFDAVVMPIVTQYSVADTELKCGNDEVCRRMMDEENEALLKKVAGEVEDELELIGVPSRLFSRVLIVPSCRLGTDANATEKGDPCKWSEWYGQYQATFFTYTMLAPFFKVSHNFLNEAFFRNASDASSCMHAISKSLGP